MVRRPVRIPADTFHADSEQATLAAKALAVAR
jgi:hypothetical protein